MLIFSLIGFNFILTGEQVVLAIYEELEAQGNQTNNANILFDAYYKENEVNTHSKQAKIMEGANLILDVTVKESGVLNDAKISFENPNFKIDKEKVNDINIKSVNDETGEIELNQLVEGTIKVNIPVKFIKSETIKADVFNRETKVKLSGNYRISDTNTKVISGEVLTRLIWTEDAEIALSQTIEKYLDLGDNGILLQQKVLVNVKDNVLPIEQEKVSITMPIIDNTLPEKTVILYNGKKLNEGEYSVDPQSNIITIDRRQEGEDISWGNGIDEYKAIYTFPKNIGYINRETTIKATANTKVSTKEIKENTASEAVELQANTGNVVTLSKNVSNEIGKGYMYANALNESEYEENISLEYSSVNGIGQNVDITEEMSFEDAQKNQYNTNNSIKYKELRINKNDTINLLGENVNISVQTLNGEILGNINKDSQANEAGNIVLKLNDITNIKVIVSNPVKEGKLNFTIKKAVSGQTGYEKDVLKTFNAIKDVTKISNSREASEQTKNVELKDTITEATLEINNNKLKALEKNENVQLSVTLNSYNDNYDLWKNPYMEITLPDGIKDFNVKKFYTLYDDKKELQNLMPVKEGNKIKIQLTGEQTEFSMPVNKGIRIILDADIEFEKTTPSKNTEIKLLYSNENSGAQKETTLPVTITSKYGTLIYNSIEEYGEGKEKLESVEENLNGEIDALSAEKQARAKTVVVNNYEKDITNVSLIGRIVNDENNTINAKIMEFAASANENMQIYYSSENVEANSDKWTADHASLNEIKSFKIELGTLKPNESVSIDFSILLPANIGKNEAMLYTNNLTYIFEEQPLTSTSNIKLATQSASRATSEDGGETINQDGVKLNVVASTTGKDFKLNDDVYEGQTVKYVVTVKNDTGKDLTNFSCVGTQKDDEGKSNVIYWDMHTNENGKHEITGETVPITRYRLDETITEKTFSEPTLKNGETKVYEYEFQIAEKTKATESTNGTIVLKADNFEKTINVQKNNINDAELKLETYRSTNEEATFEETASEAFAYKIKNITDRTLNNVQLEIAVPDKMTLGDEYKQDRSQYKYVSFDGKKLVVEIEKIDSKEEKEINIFFGKENMEKNDNKKEYAFYISGKVGTNTYYSNKVVKTAYVQKIDYTVTLTSNVEKTYIEENQEIQFVATIKNNTLDAKNKELISIQDIFEEPFTIKEAYIEKDGNKVENITTDGHNVEKTYELDNGEEIRVVMNVVLGENTQELEEIENRVTVVTSNQKVESNVLKYTIGAPSQDDREEEEKDPSVQVKKQTIKGLAWNDANKDGIRNDDEQKLEGIEVMLIDSVGSVKANTKTNNAGEYIFEDISNGKYIVIFKYDNLKYSVTQYKIGSEERDSDVILRSIQIEDTTGTYAVTDELTINDSGLANIDAGFYENAIFDLSLNKTIKRLVLQTANGSRTTEYANAKLAKIEIFSQELENAVVIIEYSIKVKNEGEIQGYATDIIDYLPKNLEFSSELNKQWYMTTDGNIHNKELVNNLIKPGETKELKLTLTKRMTENNLGTITNLAEIESAINDIGTDDRDSTPGNKKDGEDDISSAEVIVSIGTGATTIMTTLGIVTLVILSVILFVMIYGKKNKEEVE